MRWIASRCPASCIALPTRVRNSRHAGAGGTRHLATPSATGQSATSTACAPGNGEAIRTQPDCGKSAWMSRECAIAASTSAASDSASGASGQHSRRDVPQPATAAGIQTMRASRQPNPVCACCTARCATCSIVAAVNNADTRWSGGPGLRAAPNSLRRPSSWMRLAIRPRV